MRTWSDRRRGGILVASTGKPTDIFSVQTNFIECLTQPFEHSLPVHRLSPPLWGNQALLHVIFEAELIVKPFPRKPLHVLMDEPSKPSVAAVSLKTQISTIETKNAKRKNFVKSMFETPCILLVCHPHVVNSAFFFVFEAFLLSHPC